MAATAAVPTATPVVEAATAEVVVVTVEADLAVVAMAVTACRNSARA